MSSELGAAPEQRLHPLSWLFVLLGQLRQFAVPLLLLLVTGRRSNADLYGLIGVGALVLYAVAQYFTYRYRIDADGVVIRSGLLQRSLRHIPFGRIQDVTLHQSLLHRIFGVAEVRLESAGAPKPEGRMRVLRLDAAHELERQIRARGAQATAGAAAAAPAPAALIEISTADVLRLGLIDNRGLIVVGSAFAVLAQTGDNTIGQLFDALGRWLSGHADTIHLGLLGWAAAGLGLLLAAIVALRLFSMALALLQFHGFRLSEQDGRLSVERGLLARTRGSAPRHRIQAFNLREGLLHRLLGRQSLRVDTAVMTAADETAALRDLVPIATPGAMSAVIGRLLPPGAWPIAEWRPLHPRAWRRKFTLPALLLLVATAALVLAQGPWASLLLALLPVLYWRARLWARRSAYSVAHGLVAFRGGWLDRHWRFAEVGKLQAVELRQSPFDRRHGMASLRLDTAGASLGDPALTLPYLPEAEARSLYQRLAGQLR